MTMARKTNTQSPALPVADSHDLIRVHGDYPSPASTSQPTSAPDGALADTVRRVLNRDAAALTWAE
jgi:hypothetical protein